MSYSKLDDLAAHLTTLLERHHLSEIEYEEGKIRLRVSRATGGTATVETVAPATSTTTTGETTDHPTNVVTSPMVGTAYLAAEPGKETYVRVGQAVEKGDTLLLIEAMKTFTPITAPHAGTIGEIFATEGAPVEYGDRLLVLDPRS